MAHYVMADLHGEGERFHAMLKKIAFSGSDSLYILGDVVDRGPNGIALIQEIMEMPNVAMLLGNHEYMMLQYFSPDATEVDHRRWNKNGNAPTLAAFQCLSSIEQDRILDFLKTRPSHLRLEINRKSFYLIHGFPGENIHDEVWNRPTLDIPNPIPNCQLIIGHTPVLEFIQPESEQEKYAQELESAGDHLKILHAPGFIDIDCCCGYDVQGKALACIRLEEWGIKHSMSRPYKPVDNRFIETFWKSMKVELGSTELLTEQTYRMVIEYYIYYYNNLRPHSSLGYVAPLAA